MIMGKVLVVAKVPHFHHLDAQISPGVWFVISTIKKQSTEPFRL